LTSLQIILGKFLAGLAFYVVLLIPTMFFQSLLFVYGDPEFLPVLSGYLGLLLLGSAFYIHWLINFDNDRKPDYRRHRRFCHIFTAMVDRLGC